MVPLQSPCKTENNDAPSVVEEGRGGGVELGVAGAGVVVVVAPGVGVVVEAGRGGGVELEEVMFVGAHKVEGP